MITLKYLLEILGYALLAAAATLAARELFAMVRSGTTPARERWETLGRLAAAALVPLLAGLSIEVVPAGMAGVRVSQISGTLPDTLYPGLHLVVPLVQHVETFDLRDQIFETAIAPDPKKGEALKVQTKEGLEVGLAVAVRYRIDPRRLAYVQANLPQPLEEELVPPVVASTFRDLAPNYLVRDLFATRRDQIRREAAAAITRRLAPDAVIVKEVMLRDIQLPAEYAKGLEGVLLKEQENERLGVELDVKQKEVKVAELEAEAQKARDIQAAEGEAQVTVLRAKAQSDAMQYTLPLKEKQIQQTKLEAEARKEATVEQAQAMAEAKVIDGKAELEKRKLMNQADLDRVQLLSKADADKMRLEGAALKDNPLLIQKIIAEKLSDKVQIMMVPSDGKYFFSNDMLRGALPSLPALPATRVDPER
ncbi:MAG TPA: SPFH domain-containing protein [Bryobacteraceae bacterium]|nr:SPFH domain-containing protein [Bryobacteraceae bacterium]